MTSWDASTSLSGCVGRDGVYGFLGFLMGVWGCPRALGHLQWQCPMTPIEHPTLLGLEEVGCTGHLLSNAE